MKILDKIKYVALLGFISITVIAALTVLTSTFSPNPPKAYAAITRVGLGNVDNFAVFSAAAITDSAPSVVIGDVGATPIAGSAIGIPALEVTGTIYAVDGTGPSGSVNNPGLLTTARASLLTAYNDAAGRTSPTRIATNLGGVTKTAGVYDSADTTFTIAGGGTLTLNGEGNADAVFIFQMGSTLITSTNSKVVLTNGAQSCNVFWQVGSSATLGTYTTFVGNILADTTIVDNGNSTVDGRLLAGANKDSGAVTLNNTHITKSTCAAGTAGAPTPTPTQTVNSSFTTSDGRSSTGTTVCPNFSCTTPLIIESRRVDADSIFISWGPYAGINKFVVQYGFENGKWLYNTKVTGFSTTINALPNNQPIWVLISPTDDCSIGPCGVAKLVGGPGLPNTGFAPSQK